MTIRISSDLPDDEGRVFVTAVHGAPFQVLGRRGRDGHLYVADLMVAGPSASSLEKTAAGSRKLGAEIVTGKEAEDLIAELWAGIQRQ